MSKFPPEFLPADRQLGDGVSQTFLRHLNLCPRSAFFYQRYKGQGATVEMQRGKLGHRAVELATRAVIENREVMIPPELAKVMVDEAIMDPEYACPVEHHDYVREAVYRWAAETAIDADRTVAVETLYEMDVAGWRVRCRIDFAELSPDGAGCVVRDYKFGPGAPPLDEIARKRDDGTFAAKNLQLVLYALVLAYGVPVREEECARCAGSGWLCAATDGPHDPIKGTCCEPDDEEFPLAGGGCPSANGCPDCLTKGRVEIREPFPVASRVQHFDLEFVFPGIENSEGLMLRRPLSLTRLELESYRPSLEALLKTLDYRIASGDWPAVQSDEACTICPAKRQCPIPVFLRNYRGELNTPEEAAEAFEKAQVQKKLDAAMQRERRAFVEHHGPVRFGGGMVAELVPSVSTEIRDKDGFLEAVERTARYGEPLERWRYLKEKHGTRLVVRALTQDEINSEGSNG